MPFPSDIHAVLCRDKLAPKLAPASRRAQILPQFSLATASHFRAIESLMSLESIAALIAALAG